MKRFALILSAAIIAAALTGCGKKTVSLDTPEGTIVITALTSNSVRVQMAGDLATPELEELVYVNKTIYDGEVKPSDSELAGGRFWSIDEIKDNIGKGVFTPNFEDEFIGKILKTI